MTEPASLFLEKAANSLAGAESELANGRHDNVANHCYYSCFQAAPAQPPGRPRTRAWKIRHTCSRRSRSRTCEGLDDANRHGTVLL